MSPKPTKRQFKRNQKPIRELVDDIFAQKVKLYSNSGRASRVPVFQVIVTALTQAVMSGNRKAEPILNAYWRFAMAEKEPSRETPIVTAQHINSAGETVVPPEQDLV